MLVRGVVTTLRAGRRVSMQPPQELPGDGKQPSGHEQLHRVPMMNGYRPNESAVSSVTGLPSIVGGNAW